MPGGKQAYVLARADGAPLALGAICESWSRIGTDRRLTCAIVTTPLTQELTGIHARMPLVLEQDDWPLWRGETEGEPAALMRPTEPSRIKAWPVGKAIGSPHNNRPELLAAA